MSWARIIIVVVFVLLASMTAHAVATDDQRLATLAARMLDLKAEIGSNDYIMSCGPAGDVLPASPPTAKQSYCVLNASGGVIVGVFAVPTSTSSGVPEILQQYTAASYAKQVKSISQTACNGKGFGGEFELCSNAITTTGQPALYVYAYDNSVGGTQAVYVIISDRNLSTLSPTFFDRVLQFFKNLFGGA